MTSIQINDAGRLVDQQILIGAEGVPAVGDTLSVVDFENGIEGGGILGQYTVKTRNFIYDKSGQLEVVALNCLNSKDIPDPFPE
ncbi:MAG: hypothetical protein QOE83_348 [Actinomycetota bacterium]|jgi:hypothetical protein|nr:hypothetical protein [Actinomycetota bacterium]